MTDQNLSQAAAAMGRLGGSRGTGPAKSRSAQLKAWWNTPAGTAEKQKRSLRFRKPVNSNKPVDIIANV